MQDEISGWGIQDRGYKIPEAAGGRREAGGEVRCMMGEMR
jgi:hypothetical protein